MVFYIMCYNIIYTCVCNKRSEPNYILLYVALYQIKYYYYYYYYYIYVFRQKSLLMMSGAVSVMLRVSLLPRV